MPESSGVAPVEHCSSIGATFSVQEIIATRAGIVASSVRRLPSVR